MKGAGIKFKFKNGKTLRISSNDNFCNSEDFVSLCHNIDTKLLKFNNGEIERKKSFFESKKGYYYAIIMTILVVAITFYKLSTDGKFNFTNIALILVTLTTIWSSVRYKRKNDQLRNHHTQQSLLYRISVWQNKQKVKFKTFKRSYRRIN